MFTLAFNLLYRFLSAGVHTGVTGKECRVQRGGTFREIVTAGYICRPPVQVSLSSIRFNIP